MPNQSERIWKSLHRLKNSILSKETIGIKKLKLIEYKEGTAPAGHFEIPKGYKKTESMWEQQ